MSESPEIWTDNQDELRRAFLISHFQWSPDHKTGSQIRALEAQFQWLKNGTVPTKKTGLMH